MASSEYEVRETQPFNKDKETLIEELSFSNSFTSTHSIISKLEQYPYFSLEEVYRILDIISENDQVSWILEDTDVSDFLNRVAAPYLDSISSDIHREIIHRVIDEKKERLKKIDTNNIL